VHLDLLRCREEIEIADVAERPVVGTDEEHGNPERLMSPACSGDDLRRGVVTTGRIDGDREY
jgi:hypothetical protein